MRVFHTGNREIRDPDIRLGRRNADFGQGFYLSAEESFAANWARERTAGDIYVNVYELETDGLEVLVMKRDGEWFEYIFGNRRGQEDRHKDADVIIGPIANDTLFETFGIITSGLITEEQALELLEIGPEYTQVVIKSEKAAAKLRWTGAYVLDDSAMSSARIRYEEESEKYGAQFAAAIDRITD